MEVILTDSEYNRKKNVVGKSGVIRYSEQTLGTLIKIDDGNEWIYYFKGKEEFNIK